MTPTPDVTTADSDEQQWKADIDRAMQVLRFGVTYAELAWYDQRDVLAVAEAIHAAEAAVHARYEQLGQRFADEAGMHGVLRAMRKVAAGQNVPDIDWGVAP